MIKPLNGLWEILLQRIAQPIGKSDFIVDQYLPLFDEKEQVAHPDALRLQGFELVAMIDQGLQRNLGVTGMGIGSAAPSMSSS